MKQIRVAVFTLLPVAISLGAVVGRGSVLADSPCQMNLQRCAESLASAHHGRVALWAKHLATGDTLAIEADTPVRTASVIKLPIMTEAFLEVRDGKRRLSDPIVLRDADKTFGSGAFHFMHDGLQLTLEDTIWNMMIFSDNTATNLMIEALGTAAVNERMKSLGLQNSWLYKKIGRPAAGPMPADQKQFGLGKTTARDMGRLLEWLVRCGPGDAALCRKMTWIMRNQQDRTMLARYLETRDPTEQETPSYVAAKLGALDEVRNEVGILYTKAGPIVIAAFTWDNVDRTWTPENEALRLIATLAREIVSVWSPAGMQTTGEVPIVR
jgi:beta-lactamase class A